MLLLVPIALLTVAEVTLMAIVCAQLGIAAPMDELNLVELMYLMSANAPNDWLRWNQMAWSV